MHVREIFAVREPAELEALLAELRLGCLVTVDEGQGLTATHLPFVYDAARRTFCGHVSRENRQWSRGDGTGLVIFQTVEAYVSPNWYPAKREHGRVVPTWNYEAVHVHGRIAWDASEDWLLAHLAALTDRFEAGESEPWRITDAPEDFIRRLAAQVVGVEVQVERVEAIRKLSQNRAEADRRGVVAGLSASPRGGDRATAERIRQSLKG